VKTNDPVSGCDPEETSRWVGFRQTLGVSIQLWDR
jgi:hypothetical protein